MRGTKRVNLYMEESLWAAVRREAKALGLPVAGFVRMCVGERLRAERLKAKSLDRD